MQRFHVRSVSRDKAYRMSIGYGLAHRIQGTRRFSKLISGQTTSGRATDLLVVGELGRQAFAEISKLKQQGRSR